MRRPRPRPGPRIRRTIWIRPRRIRNRIGRGNRRRYQDPLADIEIIGIQTRIGRQDGGSRHIKTGGNAVKRIAGLYKIREQIHHLLCQYMKPAQFG